MRRSGQASRASSRATRPATCASPSTTSPASAWAPSPRTCAPSSRTCLSRPCRPRPEQKSRDPTRTPAPATLPTRGHRTRPGPVPGLGRGPVRGHTLAATMAPEAALPRGHHHHRPVAAAAEVVTSHDAAGTGAQPDLSRQLAARGPGLDRGAMRRRCAAAPTRDRLPSAANIVTARTAAAAAAAARHGPSRRAAPGRPRPRPAGR